MAKGERSNNNVTTDQTKACKPADAQFAPLFWCTFALLPLRSMVDILR
jgi:hypothetical protein